MATQSEAADINWNKLVEAIIEVESGGNSNAVSPKGAIGLMQISKSVLAEYNHCVYKGPLYGSTCYSRPNGHVYGCVHVDWKGIKTKKYTEQDLYIGEISMEIGEWYLHRLKNHYLKDNYTLERLLAAYNGGITCLRKVNYDIKKMSSETRNYVKKVLKIYDKK